MLVQTYFPRKLSPSRYDQYLASGWFRGSVMLYKMGMLCLEGDVQSVINIRLDVRTFSPSKSQRKLLTRAGKRYRTEIRRARIDNSKEALYQEHKHRFKGFIHHSLTDYLNSGFASTVFDTYEVCVFDGDELVAASFFDLGKESMASLLCVYKDSYARSSLGKYTLLCEIAFAQKRGLKWFYPGYVLQPSRSFDYKLEVGQFQYYNANKRWVRLDAQKPSETAAVAYLERTNDLRQALQSKGLEYKQWLYPFFTMGYLEYWDVKFLSCPIFLEVSFGRPGREMLTISYEADSQMYMLLLVTPAEEHYHLLNMEVSADFYQQKDYFMDLIKVSQLILISSDLHEIVDATWRIANAAPKDLG